MSIDEWNVAFAPLGAHLNPDSILQFKGLTIYLPKYDGIPTTEVATSFIVRVPDELLRPGNVFTWTMSLPTESKPKKRWWHR